MSENKNRIEDLKKKLYDPDYDESNSYRTGILHEQRHEVKEAWEKEETMNKPLKKPKMSIFKKFFMISIIFFIGAVGYASYKFLLNDSTVTSNKIDLEVIGNSFTKGGEELPLQIEITNRNSASLELASLIVEYPKGADDNSSDMIRLDRDQIGTIKPGESVIRNVKVKLYGAEKSVRNIKASLEYHPEGSNAVFTKDKYYPVTISLAPLSLKMEAPDTITTNQVITLKVITTLNTALSNDHPILEMTYPNNFVFESSNIPALNDNSSWDLSAISLTTPITVEIKGKIIGQVGDEQVFHAYVGTASDADNSKVSVVYSSILQKVTLENPFLDIKVLVNSQDSAEYSIENGKEASVSISWKNNLSTNITDAEIVASLSGNVFDKNQVKESSGYYDSLNNQIIWNKSTYKSLSNINPGETGNVSFYFTPQNLALLSNIRNPQVSISVSIKGRQPVLGSEYSSVDNFTEKIVKVKTDFQIASSLTYLSGALPPKAENETNYVITWTLSNTTNSVNQAVAVATLPIYTNWVGFVAGTKENISYNDVSREVTWKIGSVSPNTGIDTNREVSFIVTFKPSLSQVGLAPTLIKNIVLSGQDSFSGSAVGATKSGLNISSISGVAAGAGNGQVTN